jgi:hypothetical protein
MALVRRPSFLAWAGLAVALALASPASAPAAEGPGGLWWLPHYDLEIDLDVAGHQARVRQRATWTNPHPQPAGQLVFNAHSHYVVPKDQVGFMAKTLEILRLDPGTTLGVKAPPLDVQAVTLLRPEAAGGPLALNFRYEGPTETTLAMDLPHPVARGESVTVLLDFVLHLPPKQGRWGQWCGVTFLSNWLPVFAVYGDKVPPPPRPDKPPPSPEPPGWQPTPFVPWHQPFFNEAASYRVRVNLPADQKIACTGTITCRHDLPDGRQFVEIEAPPVRDFAFLCSALYRETPGEVVVDPSRPPVRVHVLAFPEHAWYAEQIRDIVCAALAAYSRWFGPYPYADFTIAESYFGWNGNECGTLVMVDARIFGMPHLARAFVDSLVSHEVCHQWWYNVVGTNGWCETWMDEGLATYFAHRLCNQKYGKNNNLLSYPEGLGWLPNIRRETYRSYGMYGTLRRGENGPVVQEMTGFGHVVNLFSLCYDKGSRIVGTIEERLGPDALLGFMRTLYRKYCYRILRVADFQRELEAYTGFSWAEFFAAWIYGPGVSDWAVDEVRVQAPPKCCRRQEGTRVTVWLEQRGPCIEQTTLAVTLPGCEGRSLRLPILLHAEDYEWDEPPAHVTYEEVQGAKCRVRVDLILDEEPEQIEVDPDQVLVDLQPSNNFWKAPVHWRVTPIYTFLDDSDLTCAHDRWNFTFGPWFYGQAYTNSWYTRSTMLGVRLGAYRTQDFAGGVYAAYRTDFRDVLVGVDALWDHWPDSHFQTGFMAEERLFEFYSGDPHALRAALYSRYVFKYLSSMYLLPMEYITAWTAYQDNFLPFLANPTIEGERFDRLTTAGLHYHRFYLTPYWYPVGGYQFDVWTESGMAAVPYTTGLAKLSSQFSFVQSLPDLSGKLGDNPTLNGVLGPMLRWLGDNLIALRIYGGTSAPNRGEFFTMGGGALFRGFDLAQRQGGSVWVGSVEWRMPLATGLTWDFCDHTMGLRNVYGAAFYDVGNAYVQGHEEGPTAQAVGVGLRLDVSWFSLVERTTLRFDIAKTLNASTPIQMWFGVGVPF